MKPYSEAIREAALWYIEHGYRIFPVHSETKVPLVPGGFYSATKDPAIVMEWLTKWPNMGIGLPTGVINGLFVVDVDERSNGFVSLQSLVEANSPLPPTPIALTQNDGLHYYFSYPSDQLRTTKLAPGIDIKSDGGYVVAPPTMRPDGRGYRWQPTASLSQPLAVPPQWLLDSIRTEAQRQDDDWAPASLVYPEGMRENILIKFMGTLIRKGASNDAIEAFVRAENATRCKPPLTESELADFIGRVTGRYAPKPENSLGVMPSSLIPTGWGLPSTMEGVLSPSAGHIDELIEGIVGKGSVSILAAAWKSGKTLVTYRLILDALQGKPVWGMYPTSKPLKILMLQFEMPSNEDDRRFRRLALGSSVNPKEFVAAVANKRYVHFSRPNMTLVGADARHFRQYVLAEEFDLVVIDSLTAAFAGQDLNDNSAARVLFNNAFSQITTAGCSVLVLHHKRKRPTDPKLAAEEGKGAVLGAQAWGAAADRTFSLDNVPRSPLDPVGPGEFKVRLEVLGTWAPTDLHGLTIAIRDDGDGTVLEPIEDPHTVLAPPSKVEDAARDLADFVATQRVSILGDAERQLIDLGYSRAVRRRAKLLAMERGWVVESFNEFGKVKKLLPGPSWLK